MAINHSMVHSRQSIGQIEVHHKDFCDKIWMLQGFLYANIVPISVHRFDSLLTMLSPMTWIYSRDNQTRYGLLDISSMAQPLGRAPYLGEYPLFARCCNVSSDKLTDWCFSVSSVVLAIFQNGGWISVWRHFHLLAQTETTSVRRPKNSGRKYCAITSMSFPESRSVRIVFVPQPIGSDIGWKWLWNLKISFPAQFIMDFAFIHHLQENIINAAMGFLNLIE